MNDSTIDTIFRQHFSTIGREVRQEQKIVIDSVLAGNNTLSLMPTGGGKSLCYWIAGMALGGTTLVVFPLTALMDEQADKLRSHGLDVAVLHSGIPSRDQYKQLVDLYHGRLPRFIFTSPERLATDGFLEYVLHHRKDAIKLVVIDEIHCISQWGHDFRPFYREIPPFLDNVFQDRAHWPIILGLTATLNKKDTEQVCQDFGIQGDHVYKSQHLLRYEIQLRVVKVDDEIEKDRLFWEELSTHRDEKVLIYIDNRRSGDRSTEKLSARAVQEGYRAAYFHGSMTSEQKADVIRKFKSGQVLTVFATSAFGMGIDIPDIRGVIHYRPPESIEQYYQQIGRVGRDRKPSWALMYYSEKNVRFRKSFFIDKSFPDEGRIRRAFKELTSGRGRVKSFNFFGEEDGQSAFHYLLRSELIRVRCKGVDKIDVFSKSGQESLPRFDEYQQATRTQLAVVAAVNLGIPVEALMEDIYRWLAEKRIKAERTPQKVLIVEQLADDLPEWKVQEILEDASHKQSYRYELLDQLVRVLDGFSNSISLHQEIGRYLGLDQYQMGRIHQTLSGVMVRSKSEVIIANLLWEKQVPFRYEEPLKAEGYGFSPDFTISVGERTIYWEHLGLLERDQYRQSWEVKRQWYERNFPGQLMTTEEASTLSQTAEALIKNHLWLQLGRHLQTEQPTLPEDAAVQPATAGQMVALQAPVSTRKVLLLTEGQTDWKHLKSAFTRLKAAGQFSNLDIEFREDESDMGDKELLRDCRSYARGRNAVTTFCLFDRDVPSTLREVTEGGQDYKYWGNRVYSVALPLPPHRRETPEISIEFYYHDEEIQRKDNSGRRLYIGTEFPQRNLRHVTEPLTCPDRNKAGKFTIIDQQIYDENDQNVALSKQDFARNVLNRTPGFGDFDLSAFEALFELIESLASENEPDAVNTSN